MIRPSLCTSLDALALAKAGESYLADAGATEGSAAVSGLYSVLAAQDRD
jgi:hypothetical protein